MPVIQLELPPDLEQFAVAQAKTEGHANLHAYLVEMLRKMKAAKTKADLEAELLAGLEQLDRGEGIAMTAQDWQTLRGDYCQRHGIPDET